MAMTRQQLVDERNKWDATSRKRYDLARSADTKCKNVRELIKKINLSIKGAETLSDDMDNLIPLIGAGLVIYENKGFKEDEIETCRINMNGVANKLKTIVDGCEKKLLELEKAYNNAKKNYDDALDKYYYYRDLVRNFDNNNLQ